MALQPTYRNPTLERIRAGEVALGMIVRFARSGEIAQIAKTSGHDFIFLDTQHALFSPETIAQITQVALGCGVTPLVRVRSCDDANISVLLDAGVAGIIFPDIGNAEQARRAVAACRLPPLSRRSVTGPYATFDFCTAPLDESKQFFNDNTLVICMIESCEGLANLEDIATIEGVDILHMGCSDMLVDMGKPGCFGDPEIVSAIERLIGVCQRHGKIAGLGGDRDIERQARFINQGVRFVTTQTDLSFLMTAASKKVTALREAIKSPTSSSRSQA